MRWLSRLLRAPEAGLVVVTILLFASLSAYGHFDARPGRANTFLNLQNLLDGVATPMSYFAIMAVGMTCVIIAGGIDISVGSTMACAALAGAWTLLQLPTDVSWPLAVGVGIGVPTLVGLLCGLANGALIVGLRIHPFIVTLATMSILRGLSLVLPPTPTLPSGLGQRIPPAFTDQFMRWRVGRLIDSLSMDERWPAFSSRLKALGFDQLEPMPMIVMLIVAFLGWLYLHRMVYGRETYAIGGNEEAARFSGLNVPWIKLRTYALAGITAGVAGVVSLGRFGTASTTTGSGYELTVIAAAVVGGASLAGGRGSALGALLGALILTLINNAIDILHLPRDYERVIIGGAIILAVAVDQLSSRLRRVE